MVMVVAGGLLVVDAGLTLVWQEPVTSLYAKLRQGSLEDELRRRALELSAAERRALRRAAGDTERLAVLAKALRRRSRAGEPLGRVAIPRLGVDQVLLDGIAGASLRQGPAHYRSTPLPGSAGTVGIAGHRTTYGAPFGDIDRLRRGDEVVLEMPYGDFVYEVRGTRIVRPEDVEVLDPATHEQVVLTACHPRYSATQRIIATARLEKVVPKLPLTFGRKIRSEFPTSV